MLFPVAFFLLKSPNTPSTGGMAIASKEAFLLFSLRFEPKICDGC